jgi:hypothetical protein
MSYKHGSDLQLSRRYGLFKYSLTRKLFIYWKKRLYFPIYSLEKKITPKFNKCSKQPLSAWMYILTRSTTESVTLRRNETSVTRLEVTDISWSVHLLGPSCFHASRFSCNPAQGNLANFVTVTVVATSADRVCRSIGQGIAHSDAAWRSWWTVGSTPPCWWYICNRICRSTFCKMAGSSSYNNPGHLSPVRRCGKIYVPITWSSTMPRYNLQKNDVVDYLLPFCMDCHKPTNGSW